MKRVALVTVLGLGLLGGVMGCEEKAPEAPKGGMLDGVKDAAKGAADKAKDAAKDTAKAAGDAAHAAADKAKDAAHSAADAAKATADKAKDAAAGAADKAKEAAAGAMDAAKEKAMAGLKTMMDGAKDKIAALTKGGEALPADKKPDFTKAMSGITEQFGALTKNFDGLKSLSGDGLMTKIKELTGSGEGLMKTITETAAKFGIKL